jgi:hypothetical protein
VVLVAVALLHFTGMAFLTAQALELSLGLAPSFSLAAALLICLVPVLGYAVAACFAAAVLEWSLLASLTLFLGPSMLWVLVMWNTKSR